MPLFQSTKPFLDWAASAAIRLSLDSQEDVEKLSALDGVLCGKRIVYLGEEDHWVHEKSDYRMLLLRYLISRGFTIIGEELGWSDGLRIDQYLHTGDDSPLGRIATYGYTGDRRDDREELPRGILQVCTDEYPAQAFRSEQLRLVAMLRKSNECRTPQDRIRYFGFDVNAVVGGGYADIGEQLRPFSGCEVVSQLLSKLRPIPNETYEDEIARLGEALDLLAFGKDELIALAGENALRSLDRNVRTVQESLRYHRIANSAVSYQELNPAMAIRETLMADHVEHVLQTFGKNHKFVLMGHNRHLSKDIFRIRNAGACPPGGNIEPSLGTYLFGCYPREVFSIWMLFESGQSSSPDQRLGHIYTPRPRSLNALLSRVGETFLLPISSADPRTGLLKRPLDITGIYNVPFRAAIADQADAIFFTRTVSKLRL